MSTIRMPALALDCAAVPFSRRGAWMAVSWQKPKDGAFGLWIRDLRSAPLWQNDRRFLVELVRDGTPLPCTVAASGSELTMRAEGATARLAFAAPDVLRLRAEGATLRLSGGELGQELAAGWLRVLHGSVWGVEAVRGRLALDAPWTIDAKHCHRCVRVVMECSPDGDGAAEIALVQDDCDRPRLARHPDFAAVAADAAADLAAWWRRQPAVAPRWRQTAALAAYVNWSSEVEPAGHVTRRVLLMSKNWMRGVWSWDHCFNALALALGGDRARAWDNFMVFGDRQLDSGAFADLIAPAMRITGYVKPPVHGWTLGHLRRLGVPDRRQLAAAYAMLARASRFWLERRDPDGVGLPFYYHGNDSGWDNASLFDMGFPAAGPDLAALLADQLHELAACAETLGRRREARAWSEAADRLVRRLVEHLWVGDRFVARRRDGTHVGDDHACLLTYLPLILGRRLPPAIRRSLLARLEGSGLLTAHGPATEAPGSPHHVDDGYWRGPIWGPSTVLLVEGLRRSGAAGLARRTADAYLALCARSGFAENFAASDGRPLRDPAYTWTSSAWLWLAARR